MQELFADLPEAIDNITGLVAKVETFTLSRDVLLPKFDIPDEFIDHANRSDQLNKLGLSCTGIENKVKALLLTESVLVAS